MKEILNVEGMSCSHCEMAVKNELNDLDGVNNVIVSLENKTVEIEFDEEKTSLENIKNTIIETGYQVV